MKERFLTPSAVIMMLIKTVDGEKYILLQRRQNTGFADGLWDLSCSGHVEEGECMTDACLRECREELGVQVSREHCCFFALVHKHEKSTGLTYYNGYFAVQEYDGEPSVCEPEKCAEIRWFPIHALPCDLIGDRREAVSAYFTKKPYIEYGWDS